MCPHPRLRPAQAHPDMNVGVTKQHLMNKVSEEASFWKTRAFHRSIGEGGSHLTQYSDFGILSHCIAVNYIENDQMKVILEEYL